MPDSRRRRPLRKILVVWVVGAAGALLVTWLLVATLDALLSARP